MWGEAVTLAGPDFALWRLRSDIFRNLDRRQFSPLLFMYGSSLGIFFTTNSCSCLISALYRTMQAHMLLEFVLLLATPCRYGSNSDISIII